MVRNKRVSLLLFLLPLLTLAAGCRLNYAGESFSLRISPEGAAELEIHYRSFGSGEIDSALRRRDLEVLKDAVREDDVVKDAAEKGVEIAARRLDFKDYSMGGYVKARAKSYKDFFRVFTHYTLEVEDRIYITPQNGVVKRATLSGGGEIVIRNNRYTFAWPLGTKDISFEAAYKTEGVSFSRELAGNGG
ncbi:MAG: hypothetical protein ACNS63_00010 [Candidatus Nitrospinota bacterium M3_3B_026]